MKKHLKDKIFGIFITLLVAAIFVGPRLMGELGYVAPTLDYEAEKIRTEIGEENFETILKGVLPLGLAGLCLKKQDNENIRDALMSFNLRNKTKMDRSIQELEDSELSDEGKDVLDRYVMVIAKKEMHEPTFDCAILADRINSGEWDL